MKLFQQMLVAPPPLAFWHRRQCRELNINGVSITRLPLIRHQRLPILRRLPHRLGLSGWAGLRRPTAASGYPNGTFRGNRAMTRYEAAAILNACLDRVTEGPTMRRLMSEFESELAILKGRVDGLEAVGELATQFSTTTKLKATLGPWVQLMTAMLPPTLQVKH